jgi:hypothetical protein
MITVRLLQKANQPGMSRNGANATMKLRLTVKAATVNLSNDIQIQIAWNVTTAVGSLH